MCPIEWISIVQPDKIVAGDLVLSLGDHQTPAIVVEAPSGARDESIMLLAYPNEPKCPFERLDDVTEDKIIIRDWRIVVDRKSAIKFDSLDNKYGSLVIKKNIISLVTIGGNGFGYAKLPFREIENGSTTSREYAFPIWKIVKMDGDTEVVLLDRTQ